MATKKSILYVITQGAWGGAQRYVYDLATGLAGDYNVTVAVGEPEGIADLQNKLAAWNKLATSPDITVVQLRRLVRPISFYNDPLAVLELTALYKKIKPDIIHLNSTKAGIIGSLATTSYPDGQAGIPSLPRDKLSRRPGRDPELASGQAIPTARPGSRACLGTSSVVYTVHGWIFNEPLPAGSRWLYTFLEAITARYKTHFIVLSPQDAAMGSAVLHLPPGQLRTVPLGLAPPPVARTRAECRAAIRGMTGSAADGLWVGVIAGLYRTKGIDILLEAVKKIPSPPTLHFIVIGDGPERTALQTTIAAAGLAGTVLLLGQQDAAARLLPAFDLFVLPSRKEGLPYVLLEAMAAGVPVVATSVGGVPSLIEDTKTGLLVPPADPAALAAAIQSALRDPAGCRIRASAATTRASTLSLPRMMQATRQVYEETI